MPRKAATAALALALALALTLAAAQVVAPDPPTLTACTLSATEVPEFLLSQRVHVGWTSTNLYSPSNVRVSLEAADDGTEAAVVHETLPNTGVLEWVPELTGGLPAIGVNGSVEFVLRIRSLEDARGEDTTQRFRLYNGTAIAYEKSVENCLRTRTEAECEDPATLEFPFEYPFGGRNVPADANNGGISLPLFSSGLPLSTSVNSYRHLSVYDAFLLGLNDGSRLLRSVGIVALRAPNGPLENFRLGTAATDRVNITRSALLGDPDAFLTAAQYERGSVAPGDVTVLDWQDYDLATPQVLPARGSLMLEFSSVSEESNSGAADDIAPVWLWPYDLPDVPVSAALHNENADSWANQEYPYEQPLSTTVFEYLPYLRVRVEELREGGVQDSDTLQCGAAPVLQSRTTDFVWSRVDDERPSPRAGASMTSYEDEDGRKYVVLYGGTSYEPAGPVFHGDLWLYTVSERRWQQYTPAGEDADACWDASTLGSSVNLLKVDRPDCAADHTATMINGEQMVLFGGRNARGVIDDGGFGHAFVLNVDFFVRCMRGDVACGSVWLDTEKRTDRARLAQFGVQCGTPRSFGCGSVASQFEPAGLYADTTQCCPIVADLTTNARGEVRPTYGHSAASDGNGTLWLYGGVGKDTDGDETRTDQLVRMSFAPWYIDNNSSRPFENDTILEGTNIYSSDARWELLAGSGDLDSASCGDTASGRCVSYATMEHTAAGLAGDGATLVLFGGEHGAEPSTRERTNRMLGLAAADGAEAVLQAEDCDVASAGQRPSCRAHHTSGARGGVLLHYGGTADILDLEGEQAPGPTNNLWALAFDATRTPVWQPQSFEECRPSDSGFTATQCVNDARFSVFGNTMFLFGGEVPSAGGVAYTDDFWANRLRPLVSPPEGGVAVTLPTEGGPAGSRRLGVNASNVFPPNLNAADFDNSTVRVLIVGPWEQRSASGQFSLDAASVCELHSVQLDVDAETGLTDGRSALECDVPAGVGAQMRLVVFVNDTGLWYSDPVPFFSFEPPRVDSVSIDGDAAPSTAGGAVLTLRGENLGAAGAEAEVAVSAGPYACEVLAASSAEVTCRLAGGSGGGHLVTLTAGLGDEGAQSSESPAGSEISYAVPVVTGIAIEGDPARASTAGTQAFTVEGHNFGALASGETRPATVCFGPESARGCDSTAKVTGNSTVARVEGVLPPWGGSEQVVTVTVDGLESVPDAPGASGASVSFELPTVVRVDFDSNSSTAGGANVVVYGTGFGPNNRALDATVLLGDTPCNETLWREPEVMAGSNDTRVYDKLVCVVPNNIAGQVEVTVEVLGQRSESAQAGGTTGRNVYQPGVPSVSSVTPSPIFTGVETRVTIAGANFGLERKDITVELGGGARCTDVIVLEDHRLLSCIASAHEDADTLSLVVVVGELRSQPAEIVYEFTPIPSHLVRAMNITALVAIVILLVLWLNVIRYRGNKIIRAASVLFSSLIIFGGVVTVSSVFFFQHRTAPGCTAGVILLMVGFTTTYSTLVIKNYRILKLFNNKTMKPGLLRSSTMMAIISGLVLVDFAILLPYSTVAECSVPDDATGLALMATLGIKQLVTLVVGVVIAFKSRVIHIDEFNERVSLGYAIYNITVSLLTLVPIAFLFRDEVEAQYVLRTAAIIIVTVVTIGILFGPKFYTIWRINKHGEDEENLNRGTSMRTLKTGRSTRRQGSSRRGLTRNYTASERSLEAGGRTAGTGGGSRPGQRSRAGSFSESSMDEASGVGPRGGLSRGGSGRGSNRRVGFRGGSDARDGEASDVSVADPGAGPAPAAADARRGSPAPRRLAKSPTPARGALVAGGARSSSASAFSLAAPERPSLASSDAKSGGAVSAPAAGDDDSGSDEDVALPPPPSFDEFEDSRSGVPYHVDPVTQESRWGRPGDEAAV